MFNSKFISGCLAIFAVASAEQTLEATSNDDNQYAAGFWKSMFFGGTVDYPINVGFFAANGGDVVTEEKKLSDLMAQEIKFGAIDVTD